MTGEKLKRGSRCCFPRRGACSWAAAKDGVYQEAARVSGRGPAGFGCVFALQMGRLRGNSNSPTSKGALWRPPWTPVRTCAYRQSRDSRLGEGRRRPRQVPTGLGPPPAREGSVHPRRCHEGCEGASVSELPEDDTSLFYQVR